jgi:hypothetical protein
VRDLGDDVSRHYELTLGRDERTGDHRYLYEALVLALRDRMVGSWRHTQGHYLQSNEQAGGLPVHGIPHRAQPAQRDPVHGRRGRGARGGCALCLPSRTGGGGAGRGPRQRRPRAPRGLFPRQLCVPRPAGHGLRHPLRVRHVPAGPARRLPGRGAGPLAAPRQSLGIRACANARGCAFGGRTVPTGRAGAPAPSLGGYARRSRRALRHAGARLPQRHGEHAAPVAREATQAFDLEEFNAGSYSDAVAAKTRPSRSPWCCTRTTRARRQGPAPAPAVLPRLGEPAGHPGTLGARGHGEDFEGFAAATACS